MSDEPSMAQLELVANHGSGPLIRATAVVLLAERRNQHERLCEVIEHLQDD